MRSGKVQPNEYRFEMTESGAMSGIYPSDNRGRVFLGQGRFQEEQITSVVGRRLDPLLADWMEIAFAVFWAERLAPRRDLRNQYHAGQCGRILNLRIPVRLINTWARPSVHESLCNLLGFFTEDVWQIDFTSYQGAGRPTESRGFLFQMLPSPPLRVSLFSGGLDSFAGAVSQISDYPDHSFILVSGTNNTRKQANQHSQYQAIAKRYRRDISHVTIPYEFRKNDEVCEKERLERSRGFLFLSLGAVTAIAAGCRELCVYENGVGAINLPYDGSQVGISNTRAVNPISLLRMTRFIGELTGQCFKVWNPFLFQTKGEMCRRDAVRELAEHIGTTFSCDAFPMRRIPRGSGITHCGSCTSCLLRRVSLEAADLSGGDRSDMYLRDFLCPSFQGRAKTLRGLKAMDWQVYRIKQCLKEGNPWQSLAQEFPELMDVVTEICCNDDGVAAELEQNLVRLYSQYVTEWESFSARTLVSRHALAA